MAWRCSASSPGLIRFARYPRGRLLRDIGLAPGTREDGVIPFLVLRPSWSARPPGILLSVRAPMSNGPGLRLTHKTRRTPRQECRFREGYGRGNEGSREHAPQLRRFCGSTRKPKAAMTFYASIFERSKVIAVNRAQGKVMSVTFELEGQKFMARNAGPHFSLQRCSSPSSSAAIPATGNRRARGPDDAHAGRPGQCGWLKEQVRPVVANRPQLTWLPAGR